MFKKYSNIYILYISKRNIKNYFRSTLVNKQSKIIALKLEAE